MNELTRAAIERDAAQAEREVANCAACTVTNDIGACPNLSKGFRAIQKPYPRDGIPYLSYLQCDHNRRLRAEHKIKAMQAASNLGAGFWSRTFDSYEVGKHNQMAYFDARNYATTFGTTRRWLILRGPNGTGKTHLAVAIMQSAIAQDVQPYFAPSAAMIRQLGSSYQSDTTDEYVGTLQTTGMLVIDDLGKEDNTDKAKTFIFQVIDARYNGDMPTVITTNLSDVELEARYGTAIISRLMQVADMVEVGGPDYRLEGAR